MAYCLPDEYVTNPQASHEAKADTAFWSPGELNETFQVPVYRLAVELAAAHGFRTILDIGCGTGRKLTKYVAPYVTRAIGVDQGSGISFAREHTPAGEWIEGDLSKQTVWDGLVSASPDLVLCVDVIEHLDEPDLLLEKLRNLIAATGGKLLISTPDRSLIEQPRLMGPPHNARHVREWTRSEFVEFLTAHGLLIEKSWDFLPRAYFSLRDAIRALYRVASGRHPLDSRHSMAFLLRPA